ncbi:MAG: orotate phosphoribosyltransferase [Gammaproteobacteria bacterium]|nr:orotate phosphoribosyltransferase [Gammaproteobacteria bacterium]
MKSYQKDFITFAIDISVLKFGVFTLKSGRKSPYFFNSGLFSTGESLNRLGHYYAQAIETSEISYDMVYGPAYKGIPLACAVTIALARGFKRDIPYAFNRKEAKSHGEGGDIVGAPLKGKVLIIDDVISAGTSVRESIDIIKAHGAEPAGVVIALDRQEIGTGDASAIHEVENEFGIDVTSIITLEHLIAYLQQQDTLRGYVAAVNDYRNKYGVK